MAKGVKLSAKIALDVVMFLILVLLYKAKVLTLTYHEVAGIGILLVFLIHCLFNWRWIAHNAKKLFSSETPARTKFSYWISIALVVSFFIIVISGVFISKVLFKEQIEALNMDTSIFRTLHLFFSALSLILVGIHLGLYWPMVKGFFRKTWKVPAAVAKPVSYVLLAAIVIFGAYSVPTSGFSEWLLCPVIPIQHHGHGDKGEKGAEEGTAEQSDEAREGSGERENAEGQEDERATGERSERDSAKAAAGEERGDSGEAAEGTGDGRAEEQAAGSERSERGEREGAESAERSDREAADGERSGRDKADAAGSEAAQEGERQERSERGEAAEGAGDDRAEGQAAEEAADERSERGEREGAESADRGEASAEDGRNGEHEGAAESDNGEGGEKKERSGNHGNNVELPNVLMTIARFTSVMGLFAAITYYINEALRRRKKSQA